jgi:hypothetical protein
VAEMTTVTVQIVANVTWEAFHDPQSNTWIAVCKALNLNAIGDTFADMQDCANDAMATLFLDLFKTGELEAFLRANHWRPRTELPPPGRRVRFDVPAEWRARTRFEDLVTA